jgi:hypothetical protein
MFHGFAKAKVDMESISMKEGDEGAITAYLPDMEKFAVMFSKEKWITFTMKEEEFLKNFEITKE